MKKLLASVLALAMLLSLLPAGMVSAEDTLVEGDYEYISNEIEMYTILTKYTGSGGDVVIPDTLGGRPVTRISKDAFAYCTTLTSVTIPDSVNDIDGDIEGGAFFGCSALKQVNFGVGLWSIGYCAFTGCESLTSVVIPEGATYIGFWAFQQCTSLTSVTLPKSITMIDGDAFMGCDALTDVYYGGTERDKRQIENYDSNSNLENATWHYTYPDDPSDPSYFEYTVNDGKATVTRYTGPGGDVVVPDTLSGYPVTSIGNLVFKSCSSLTSVTILDGVTSIGEAAFANCTSLATLTIPNSVTHVYYLAFYNCPALTDVYYSGTKFDRKQISISEEDDEYLNYATWHYTYPSEDPSDPFYFDYTVYEGQATITAYTGPGGDVVIPDTLGGYPVTEIHGYEYFDEYEERWTYYGAFENCAPLTSVTIPDSVTTIGGGAFSGCTSLTTVTIGDSVTSIGGSAFSGCTSLTSVTIGDSVTTIDSYAFEGCTSLSSVTIPDSVTDIGASAFEGCTSLSSVTIPDSVTTIGYEAFYRCTSLTSVTIPNSGTSVGDRAFSGCTNLTDVWYAGAKIDRALMVIGTGNTPLTSATWHYEVVSENGHYYGGPCDADCDKCGAVREVPHVYSDTCDRECNVCFAIRKPPHNYAYVCDDECDTCDFLRKVEHTYDDDYDVDCNVCGGVRTVQYEVYAFAGNSVSPEVSGLAFRFDMAVDGLSANARNEVNYGDATVTSNSDVGALKLVKMGVIVSNNSEILLTLDNVNDFDCVDIEAKYLMECEDDSATFAVRVINIPAFSYDTIVFARPYCIYEDAEGNLIVEYGDVQTATYNGALAA